MNTSKKPLRSNLRHGTGTPGPGEAVFAIRFKGKPYFFKEKMRKRHFQKFEKIAFIIF